MWKVGGIKIEGTQARNFILQTDKESSEKRKYLAPPPDTWKQREILGWVIKGKMIAIHEGPNAFLAKIGCGCWTLVEGDQMRSVSKNKRSQKKWPQFSKYWSHNQLIYSHRCWANAYCFWIVDILKIVAFFVTPHLRGILRPPVTRP